MILDIGAYIGRPFACRIELRRHRRVLGLNHREEVAHQRADVIAAHPFALFDLPALLLALHLVDGAIVVDADRRSGRSATDRYACQLRNPLLFRMRLLDYRATPSDQVIKHDNDPEFPGDALGAAGMDREVDIRRDRVAQILPRHAQDASHVIAVHDGLRVFHRLTDGEQPFQSCSGINKLTGHRASSRLRARNG